MFFEGVRSKKSPRGARALSEGLATRNLTIATNKNRTIAINNKPTVATNNKEETNSASPKLVFNKAIQAKQEGQRAFFKKPLATRLTASL